MNRLFGILALTLAWCSCALAQITKWMPNGNGGATIIPIRPSQLSENQNLSGTCVELGVSLNYRNLGDVPTWYSSDFWIQFVHSSSDTVYYRSEQQNESELFVFRFATTSVADGAPLKIRVNGWVWKFPGEEPEFVDITFEFKAYNKSQHLGTSVDNTGAEDQLFIDNSDETFAAASSALSSSHTKSPGSAAAARAETKSSIISKIKPSTPFVAMTHGNNEKFHDSDRTEEIDFLSDVTAEVVAKTLATPPYNLVIFYACSILSSPVNAHEAYEINGTDQSLLGFEHPIQPLLWTKAQWDASDGPFPITARQTHLSKHAEILLGQLDTGKTIFEALLEANDQYPPIYMNGLMPTIDDMAFVGDSLSRIKYVYMSASQRLEYANDLNRWWLSLGVF